jgi:hypothetical protein
LAEVVSTTPAKAALRILFAGIREKIRRRRRQQIHLPHNQHHPPLPRNQHRPPLPKHHLTQMVGVVITRLMGMAAIFTQAALCVAITPWVVYPSLKPAGTSPNPF